MPGAAEFVGDIHTLPAGFAPELNAVTASNPTGAIAQFEAGRRAELVAAERASRLSPILKNPDASICEIEALLG